jgi:hypothetical protein
MKNDIYFNTIASQFEQDIYGSPKGFIRWHVLWEDLLAELPHLKQGNLTILDAALFKSILGGDFSLELLQETSLMTGWNEQSRPLFPKTVIAWLNDFGMQVISKAGIRIFHDHIAEKDKEGKLEQLLTVEKIVRKREPFASLAQHIHLVCQKQG